MILVKTRHQLKSPQLRVAPHRSTEVPVLDLHLSISNGLVSTKLHDKHDDFCFDILKFPFLDGDVPRSTSLHFSTYSVC